MVALRRKVTFSKVAAGVLGLLLSPLVAAAAVAVAAADGRPVLFAQVRAGLGGRPFRMYKFRTMRPERYRGEPDDQRITRVGRLLRASSVDEVPSLWNVVAGEMTFVGPRPLPTYYTAAYNPRQAKRLDVLPGLTGLVQVQGRNSLGWDEKFELDAWYVEHRSLRLDLSILLRTPAAVLGAKGISHPGHATMPAFAADPAATPGAAAPADPGSAGLSRRST